MPEFSPQPNNEASAVPLDTPSRGGFTSSNIIARDLESAYMREVAAFPLLTQEEESRWTAQYFNCHEKLKLLLSRFTHLLRDVILELCNQASGIRISNYFQIDNDANEPTNLRQLVEAMVERIGALPSSALCYSETPNDVRQKPFWKALSPIALKTQFFINCLDKLNGAQPETYLPVKGRETILKEISSNTEGMTQAFNTLTERNLRLVISIAAKYANTGMAIADLVQEGNIGLMKAVEHFNCSFGHRFSTYASYWIRQSITKYITNHCRIIRMPANTVAQLANIRRAENEFFQKNGFLPTDEEIGIATGYTATTIKTLKKMNQQPISLQAFSLDESTFEETIPDISESGISFQQEADSQSLAYTIEELMTVLNEREQLVIKLRFGLENNEQHTFIQISKMLGISSERVRQLEGSAMRKLRLKSGVDVSKKKSSKEEHNE